MFGGVSVGGRGGVGVRVGDVEGGHNWDLHLVCVCVRECVYV